MRLNLTNPLGDKPVIFNQRFGQNLNPFYKQLGLSGHNGVDLSCADGDIVCAAHDGIVTFTGEDGSGGLGVVIRTKEPFGYDGGEAFIKSIYWHLEKGSIMVHSSDEVKAGDPIARADNTGMSTGTHLHFGIKPVAQGEQEWQWWNVEQQNGYGGAIDPEPYFIEGAVKHIFLKDMRFGDESDEVRKMQVWLQRKGFFPKAQKPTGFYGKITVRAVRDLLMANGINASGLNAGPTTRSYLNA